jgi:hypothetical protein
MSSSLFSSISSGPEVEKILGYQSLHSKPLSLPGLTHSHQFLRGWVGLGTHISFMWIFDSSISLLLIFLVFGFQVHLFPDAANSELRESMAMIVGLFVRVVFSIAVMIACCSALYIED